MQQSTKRKKVVAYVEAYDDISFWRTVLSRYETETLRFEVMLPSRTDLTRGKKAALMNQLGPGLGQYMIACVDADFDYLLQGDTYQSEAMLGNPYVIHTVAYSIENLQCYAPSLHDACVMATLNDRNIFDFEEYLRSYSEAIYELFVWSIWFYSHHRFKEFPLTAFNNIATVEHVDVNKPLDAVERVRKNVNRKVAWFQRNVPEAKGKLGAIRERLTALGVRPDNTYLYIQGHHLMDNVVGEAITPVCTILRRQREREIKALAAGHQKQLDNELSCYQHSQLAIEAVLRRNTGFKESEQYLQLCKMIEKLLQKV